MNIVLCDDHRLMRDGLRALLEKEGLTVVGEASDGRTLLEVAERLRPDLVLMDISLPELNGIDATRQLLERLPATRVIALSMHSDRRYVTTMFAAGAVGYLLKTSASEELLQAVRAVQSGLKYVSPAVAGSFVDDYLSAAVPAQMLAQGSPAAAAISTKPLSPREREVLQLLAEGRSSKDIAARLQIGAATVESHRRQIMDKLHLRTIAELTKYAIREGLTPLG